MKMNSVVSVRVVTLLVLFSIVFVSAGVIPISIANQDLHKKKKGIEIRLLLKNTRTTQHCNTATTLYYNTSKRERLSSCDTTFTLHLNLYLNLYFTRMSTSYSHSKFHTYTLTFYFAPFDVYPVYPVCNDKLDKSK